MKYIIKKSDRQYQKALKFAKERERDDYYVNNKKLLKDVLLGVITEIAVYNFLKSRGIKSTTPDLTYHIKKTHAPDLSVIGKYGVHIKSCNNTSDFQNTWTYDIAFPDKYNGLHIFCAVYPYLDRVEIDIVKAVLGSSLTGKYKNPLTKAYVGKKLCVYLADIKNLPDEVKI